MRRAPLSLRVFAINAAVLCVAAVALVLSPATVSPPVAYQEALTIVAGLAVMLLLNLWLVRRALVQWPHSASRCDAPTCSNPPRV